MVLGVTRPQTSSKRNDRAHSNSVIPAALESYNLTPFALWIGAPRPCMGLFHVWRRDDARYGGHCGGSAWSDPYRNRGGPKVAQVRCDHSDTWSRMMRHNLIPGQTTYV